MSMSCGSHIGGRMSGRRAIFRLTWEGSWFPGDFLVCLVFYLTMSVVDQCGFIPIF